MSASRSLTPAEHEKAMVDLIGDCKAATGQRTWEVFRDWVEASALAIRNGVTLPSEERDSREATYKRIEERQGPENMERFSVLLAHLIGWLDQDRTDVLGSLYMQLEIANKDTAQFFSPFELGQLATTLAFDELRALGEIRRRGYVTLSEPTCGAGGMIIAFAETMREHSLNPQKELHVTAVDLDITAVHMTYVQLSLLGIPALIVHGDVLKVEQYSVWPTPVHVVDLWDYRLKRQTDRPVRPVEAVQQSLFGDVA